MYSRGLSMVGRYKQKWRGLYGLSFEWILGRVEYSSRVRKLIVLEVSSFLGGCAYTLALFN